MHRDDPPNEHLVDAGYVSADLLVHSQAEYHIDLVGPARGNPTWQNKVEGAYTGDQFTIDWADRVVRCPQGGSPRPPGMITSIRKASRIT